jgi:FkbM family methyltransferase
VTAKNRIVHRATRSDLARAAYGKLKDVPLIGRYVQMLVRSALPPGTKLWVQIPSGLGKGLWIQVDPRFELGYSNGDYEPWLQELLRAQLRPGDCFYDIGAHTGFFAMIASKFLTPSGKIVAFEPDPDNAANLRANLEKNSITQVIVVQAAVWSSAGHLTFQRALENSNRTQGQIMTDRNARLEQIAIPSVQLDEFVFTEGHPAPQLIKMDIEGAEWEALQGARHLLERAKPKLLCEVHHPEQMRQIQEYLQHFDYLVEEWKPIHQHYADYRQLYLWAVPSAAGVSTGELRG